MTLESDANFDRKLTCAFKNDMKKVFVHRLKNIDFVLESKMKEVNQNQNSKQSDRPMQCENFILLWK